MGKAERAHQIRLPVMNRWARGAFWVSTGRRGLGTAVAWLERSSNLPGARFAYPVVLLLCCFLIKPLDIII